MDTFCFPVVGGDIVALRIDCGLAEKGQADGYKIRALLQGELRSVELKICDELNVYLIYVSKIDV